MKQTSNYKLNQWDGSDRLLRTDFNGDNTKIDAALHAANAAIASAKAEALSAVAAAKAEALAATAAAKAENRYVEILALSTTAAASQIDVDVSGIDFTKYHRVELFCDTPAGMGFNLRVNNLGGTTYINGSTSGASGGCNGTSSMLASTYGQSLGIILLYPTCANGKIGCSYFSILDNATAAYQVFADCTWGALTSFNFLGGTFPVGTKIALLGVRK